MRILLWGLVFQMGFIHFRTKQELKQNKTDRHENLPPQTVWNNRYLISFACANEANNIKHISEIMSITSFFFSFVHKKTLPVKFMRRSVTRAETILLVKHLYLLFWGRMFGIHAPFKRTLISSLFTKH